MPTRHTLMVLAPVQASHRMALSLDLFLTLPCGHVLEGGEHVPLLEQPCRGAEANEPYELLGVAA